MLDAGSSPSIVFIQANAGNFSALFSCSDSVGGGTLGNGRGACPIQIPARARSST